MRLDKNSFIGEWAPIEHEGEQLAVEEYLNLAQRQSYGSETRTVFVMSQEDRHEVRSNPRNPNAIYMRYFVGRKLAGIFLGIHVPSHRRGQGLGVKVLEHAQAQLGERGISLIHTGHIHKPAVGLVLRRAGFEPMSDDFIVELLPSQTTDDSRDLFPPNVRMLRRRSLPVTMRAGSQHGRFYNVLPNHQIGTAQVDYSKAVAIHTPYVQPQIVSQQRAA